MHDFEHKFLRQAYRYDPTYNPKNILMLFLDEGVSCVARTIGKHLREFVLDGNKLTGKITLT